MKGCNKSLFLIFLVFFVPFVLSAIPQSISFQGKLSDNSGNALTGTYDMVFRIYDNSSGGNLLWESANNSVIVDSNGIYNHILTEVNISFSNPLYLGVQVETDSEMSPRINLTSVPYAFRSEITDSFNPDMNLTLADKITFKLGELIDNLVDGWLRITGNLNVTGEVHADSFVAPYFHAKHTVSQNYGGGTGAASTSVTWGSIEHTDGDYFNFTAGGTEITLLQDGRYMVTGTVGCDNVGAARFNLWTRCYVGGSEILPCRTKGYSRGTAYGDLIYLRTYTEFEAVGGNIFRMDAYRRDADQTDACNSATNIMELIIRKIG